MPPASRNQRVPTGGDTPAPIAASSLDRPAAINAQKRSRSSRRAIPGRPGDLNLSRNARSDRRLPAIATFLPVVLRRPVDSAQYTSLAFGTRCREAGVRPSMGSVGDAYDNAMCESFFATLECELLERRRFASQAEAKMACFSFIEGWYNPARLHSASATARPWPTNMRWRSNQQKRNQPSSPTLHENGAASPHPYAGSRLSLLVNLPERRGPDRRRLGPRLFSQFSSPIKRLE